MSMMHEMNPAETTGDLSDASRGGPWGEIIRDYQPEPDTKWRFGKPNYERVNKAYFQGRSKIHKEGSLEAVVSKVVKNWEVESHHIADVKQWKTMTPDLKAALNGGVPINAQMMADVGPYNFLIGDTPLYAGSQQTFETSNTIFSNAFPEGYAWEVLEVLAGPPNVTFKWRHFGKFCGTYTDRQGKKHTGNGEILNLYGLCIAKVTETLVIESLDVYYSPSDLLTPLTTMTKEKSGAAAGSKGMFSCGGAADKNHEVQG
jgi:hypothetical protein